MGLLVAGAGDVVETVISSRSVDFSLTMRA